MIDLYRYSRQEFIVSIFVVLTIQIILGLQGFDVCDDGFVLSSFQQIFNNPEATEYNFVYYLSTIVGGIWYEMYPNGGILWFRFFTVLVNTLKFTIAFQILKEIVPKRIALVSCFMLLFVNNFGFLTYYHNYLTEVLALSSIYFFMRYFKSNLPKYLLIAGFISGINVFTRLTNITLFGLAMSIPYFCYLKKQRITLYLKPVVFYVVGSLTGLLAIYFLLISLGHLDIFTNAFLSLFDMGETKGSSHDVSALIEFYSYEYQQLFFYGIILMVSLVGLNLSNHFLGAKKVMRYAMYITAFLCYYKLFLHYTLYFIYIMGISGALFVLFSKSASTLLKAMASIGLSMALFLPIGSGGGIYSSGYMCLWLSFPLFFYWLYSEASLQNTVFRLNVIKNSKAETRLYKTLTFIIITAFISAKFYNISQQAYFDPGSRFDKTFPIQNKLATGIYTKENRARIINTVLEALEQQVKKGDYLFVYDKLPMLHFLTETKPYLYNSWVWIYDHNSFKKQLYRAENEIDIYPVVVIQKFDSHNGFSAPIPNYLVNTKDPKGQPLVENDLLKNKYIKAFLERNAYEIVWSNDFFDILKTQKKHS